MNEYRPQDIEKKWQDTWQKEGTYKTEDTSTKPKWYILDMFPYPSGEGLHVGHPKGYVATDIYSRYKRMKGFNVLHPMGWDAFGLPAENYALKNKVHPRIAVEKNIQRFKEQLSIIGLDYDWSREINTTDPAYYKFSQWIFLQIYKRGLAHQSFEPINWCPSCKTGLANEDLDGDKCERCGSIVEKKPLRQWVLDITKYADRLLEGIDEVQWPQSIKELQRNWIGRSEGAEIVFPIETKQGTENVTVFTTRIDTLFGVTYITLAPEHKVVEKILPILTNKEEVQTYIANTKKLTPADRNAEDRPKTGVILKGVHAIHPATKEKLPVYIADYVLADYGTGAVMAVPAHDERDFSFANTYNLPIKEVLEPITGEVRENEKERTSIVAIVHNKKDNTFLSINWGSLGGNLFIGGGMNKGEDPIQTAIREIQEETGYTDVKLISQTGPIHHHYVAHSKGSEARNITATVLYFELTTDVQTNTKLEADEEKKFTVQWLSESDVHTKIQDQLHNLGFHLLVQKKIYTGAGMLKDSGAYNGLDTETAKRKITEAVGITKVNYKLRDWVFARQRYWGEPIPMVFDENGKEYPVDESELPVVLPEVQSYEPSGTGESPLATITEWVNVEGTISKDGTFISKDKAPKGSEIKTYKRETNTMPQWAGSSWYYLRFMDPHNTKELVNKDTEKYWNQVDMYVGGAEHATRHLIYARFWHKVLFDIGAVSTNEPFKRLQHVGLIAGEDGRKMSKRFGNVVNPDDVIHTYGADAFRMYEMFMGPFDQGAAWSTKGVVGTRRFLERVFALKQKIQNTKDTPDVLLALHSANNKIATDIENFKLNTAVSTLMILVNTLETVPTISSNTYKHLLCLLAPFAPHLTEELWHELGEKKSIHTSTWPTYDPSHEAGAHVTIAVQVNGKKRGVITVPKDASEAVVRAAAEGDESIKSWLNKGTEKKFVYRPNMIVNYIVDEKVNN